jgi:type II secretory pathway component PulF
VRSEKGRFPFSKIHKLEIDLDYADFYENEVEEAVKALTSLMEPLMIVVLGGMVGSIIVGMYLPIFTIMDKIK